MSVRWTVDQFSSRQWGETCARFADHNTYQTWGYGEVSAAESGATISRIIVEDDSGVIGASQVRIRRIPLLRCGLAYIYFGPLVRQKGQGESALVDVLKVIRKEYVDRRGLEVRIMPNLWAASDESPAVQPFADAQYTLSSAQPGHRTIMVDLSPPADDLRKRLAQKWRNGLNQAEKRGIKVELSTEDQAMAQFEELYRSMWNRKQFESGVSVESFRKLQELLPPSDKLTVHMAYKDGEPAAGHVSSTLGDTCIYLLGASNELGRDCKASYSLQWETMMAAKNAGARWYDLGGIDPERNPGVFHFKAGLGGMEVRFAPRFEAHSPGFGRYVLPMAERVFRILKKYKSEGAGWALPRPAERATSARVSCPTMPKLSS